MPGDEKRRLLLLSAILVLISMAAASVAVVMLYRTALDQRRQDLVVTAQSQARLIESVAQHNREYSRLIKNDIPEYDPLVASLKQVLAAHNTFKGFGLTGEFTLAQKHGDQIDFIFRHHAEQVSTPQPIPFKSELAEPMRRALSGGSGAMIGIDYKGDQVLAAYEPVIGLNLGVVAKINLSEVRQPFIHTGLIVLCLTFLFVLGGIFLLRRTLSPVFSSLTSTENRLEEEIEQHQQALVALKESEERFLQISSVAEDVFWLVDCVDPDNAKIIYVNQAFERIWQCSADEVLRDPQVWIDPIHPEDLDLVQADYRSFLHGEGPLDVQFRICLADGETREIWVKGGLIRDENGHILRAAGLAHDVTGLKITEKALIESEFLYRSTFDNIQAGVAHLTLEGEILRANRFLQKMLGYSAEELSNLKIIDITAPEDLSISRQMLAQLKKGEIGTYSLAKRYLKKDGQPIWGLVSVSMQTQVDGEEGYVAVIQDIDEFKHQQDEVVETSNNLESVIQNRTEELTQRVTEVESLNNAMMNLTDDLQHSYHELEQQQVQLAEVNAELESFSYSVSHDLRAPLRHIVGFVAILKEQAAEQLDDSNRDTLQRISSAAERMGNLIDDLLTLSRVGRAGLVMAPVDMNLLFEEARKDLLPGYTVREISWEIADLPKVNGDVTTLRQAVFNLLDNAMKFSQKEPQPQIEIGSKKEDGQLVFYVRDNGAGFDPAYEEKLFQVFQRLHRDDDFAGTGIGLATVRRIITRHGGWIKAEGQLGEGACFSFSLTQEA